MHTKYPVTTPVTSYTGIMNETRVIWVYFKDYDLLKYSALLMTPTMTQITSKFKANLDQIHGGTTRYYISKPTFSLLNILESKRGNRTLQSVRRTFFVSVHYSVQCILIFLLTVSVFCVLCLCIVFAESCRLSVLIKGICIWQALNVTTFL